MAEMEQNDIKNDIKELISEFSYLEETDEEWPALIIRFEDVLAKAELTGNGFSEKHYRLLNYICSDMENIARKEIKDKIVHIRKLIHENKLFVADKEFFALEESFKDIVDGKKEQSVVDCHRELRAILNKTEKIVKTEKEATKVEQSTKVKEKPNVEEEIKEIKKDIENKSNETGVIPEFKILKWADYSEKHPTVKTKKGTVVHKGQFLYIESLKYDWTSKHIHLVSKFNKKIEEFNKVVVENGIEDTQLSKLIASIRVLITKHKEVLNECENFDDVVNAVKQQAKEIKDINTSTLNK